MSQREEQGTGRHAHKSTEEPWPHHESGKQESSSGGDHQQGSRSESGSGDLNEREYRDAQGNIHHLTRTYEEQHEGTSQGAGQKEQGREQQQQKSSSSDSESLKDREYRDEKGDEHHHTRTNEEQH